MDSSTESSGKEKGKSWDRFWTLLGKVSLVVGIIIAIIGIYEYATKKSPDLTISCQSNRFLLPQSEDRSEEARRKSYELSNYSALLQVQVTNSGNRKAEGVVLSVPTQGLYQLSRLGRSEPVSLFNGEIKVGDLLPTQYINANIWSSEYKDCRSILRVLHSEGAVRSQMELKVYGLSAWVLKYRLFELAIVALVVAFITYIMTVGKQAKTAMAKIGKIENFVNIANPELKSLSTELRALIATIRQGKSTTQVKPEKPINKDTI